jgi:hypothetical protein
MLVTFDCKRHTDRQHRELEANIAANSSKWHVAGEKDDLARWHCSHINSAAENYVSLDRVTQQRYAASTEAAAWAAFCSTHLQSSL